MENLNAENIKRGLACCKGSYDCLTCDIYKRGCAGWREGLAKDALTLITSQEQRIKELTEANERLREQNERYAELEEGCYVTGYKNIKADTVRKMQERVRKKIKKTDWLNGRAVYVEIDQIAKEMLEGEK